MRAEDLLAESAWLRRLASRLSGPDGADDLVQETYEAALRREPDTRRPLRPWLAKVLRDAWRMRARAAGRRAAREQVVYTEGGDEVPTPEALVERAQAQRMLVDRVLALREPYRGTVLLCFHEGLTAAQVAEAQGIPAGTVRWRLKVALDELRAGLGETEADRRWLIALMALPKGALIVQKTSRPLLIVVLLLALLGAFLTLRPRAPAPEAAPAPAVAASSPAARPAVSEPAGKEPPYANQPGATPRPLSGVVVFAGKPVAGADVGLYDWGFELHVTTGADGRFAFAPRRAWGFVLLASAPGRTAVSRRVDNRDPTAKLDGIVLELGGCEATLSGTIVDASGNPLPGARVRHLAAVPIPGPWGPVATTDAQGRYEICLARGRRYLRVEADGYGALFGVVDALGRQRLNLTLAPEGTVVGRVVDATSGTGIPDVAVKLFPVTRGPGSPDVATGTTDASGAFQIGGAGAGRYWAQAWAEDHVLREPVELVIEAAQVTGPVVIRMAAGASVRGVVRESGRPVAGATVILRAPIAGMNEGMGVQVRSYLAMTGADGDFEAHGAPLGATVTVEVDGHEVLAPRELALRERETRGVIIEVAGLGSIAGVVTREGAPAAGANVLALPEPAPRGTAIRRVTSDGAGAFTFVGLPAATYRVWADTPDSFTREQPRVAVADRARVTGVALVLDGTIHVAGVLVDKAGAPVEGAEVRVARTTGDDVGSSITTLDGSWDITRLIGGHYRVDVRPWPGAPRSYPGPFADLEITGDTDGVRLVVDRRAHPIAGKVVEGSAGVTDALVRAAPSDGGGAADLVPWTPWPSARTGEDGAFELVVPDDGEYVVQAQLGTQAPVSRTGVRGGTTGLVLQLVTPGAIEGRLEGLPATAVWARRDGAVSGLLASVRGDSFRFEGVPPGTYAVSASAPDGRAAAETITVEAGATARVVLAAKGTARLRGRVVSFIDGTPVPGVTCSAAAAAGEVIPFGGWNPPATAVSDGEGRFELDPAPAGDALVLCTGDLLRHGKLSNGAAVGRGDGELTVPVVRRVTEGPLGTAGIDLQTGLLVARVGESAVPGVVRGDLVVAVDGRKVAGLAPDGVLTLIGDRPPGSKVVVTFAAAGAKTLEVKTPF